MNFQLSLIAILWFNILYAQDNPLTYLDSAEVSHRFNAEITAKYEIEYPIFRVYEFEDDNGKHELVLTEKPYTEKFSDSIKAFCFLVNKMDKKLEWQLTDFILQKENSPAENSIWFWTKYLRLDDLDGNGIIDPLIVYGTSGQYGTEDGRLKILLYLNGEKHGIRHQNSGMDFGRNTRVDESYYNLAPGIQLFARDLMRLIYDSGKVIFPAGWEESMKTKKLYFDEN